MHNDNVDPWVTYLYEVEEYSSPENLNSFIIHQSWTGLA